MDAQAELERVKQEYEEFRSSSKELEAEIEAVSAVARGPPQLLSLSTGTRESDSSAMDA